MTTINLAVTLKSYGSFLYLSLTHDAPSAYALLSGLEILMMKQKKSIVQKEQHQLVGVSSEKVGRSVEKLCDASVDRYVRL